MVARFHYDDAIYERLLADKLPPSERTDVTRHIETCQLCQAKLETLAEAGIDWQDVRRYLDRSGSLGLGSVDGEGDTKNVGTEFLTPSEMPHSLGRFGRYEIMEILGRGGMGIVMRGYDPALDRHSAIKVLAPELAASAAARGRFSREAKSAAAVVHEHVVPIQTVDQENGLPYLVMPVLEGKSLEQRVRQQAILTVTETLRIGRQIALGLAAAHDQGLVHRDVKPANILLHNGVERVVITDFGLARAIDDASLTQSGTIVGTPQYMSPEQAKGEHVDARGDLFSLGSVLYFMLAGHSPFRAETTMGVLHRIVNDTPRPLRQINPEVPPWMEQIITRLLAKDPADRYASAAEVAELLGQWLAHQQDPTSEPRPSQPPEDPQPATGGGRARFTKIALGLLGSAAVLLAGIFVVLETGKGTLTIQSDQDDITVRITQGETVARQLKVTPGENRVRLAAGQYVVEIEGEHDGLTVENDRVMLARGGKEVVRIVREGVEQGRPEVGQAVDKNSPPNSADAMNERLRGEWKSPPEKPDLHFEISPRMPVPIGQPILIRAKVTNAGDKFVENVVIREIINPRLTVTAATNFAESAKNEIVWRLPRMLPGQKVIVEVQCKPENSSGHFFNRLLISANGYTIETDASVQVGQPEPDDAIRDKTDSHWVPAMQLDDRHNQGSSPLGFDPSTAPATRLAPRQSPPHWILDDRPLLPSSTPIEHQPLPEELAEIQGLWVAIPRENDGSEPKNPHQLTFTDRSCQIVWDLDQPDTATTKARIYWNAKVKVGEGPTDGQSIISFHGSATIPNVKLPHAEGTFHREGEILTITIVRAENFMPELMNWPVTWRFRRVNKDSSLPSFEAGENPDTVPAVGNARKNDHESDPVPYPTVPTHGFIPGMRLPGQKAWEPPPGRPLRFKSPYDFRPISPELDKLQGYWTAVSDIGTGPWELEDELSGIRLGMLGELLELKHVDAEQNVVFEIWGKATLATVDGESKIEVRFHPPITQEESSPRDKGVKKPEVYKFSGTYRLEGDQLVIEVRSAELPDVFGGSVGKTWRFVRGIRMPDLLEEGKVGYAPRRHDDDSLVIVAADEHNVYAAYSRARKAWERYRFPEDLEVETLIGNAASLDFEGVTRENVNESVMGFELSGGPVKELVAMDIHGKFQTSRLDPPINEKLSVVFFWNDGLLYYTANEHVYAFSPFTGTWDALKVPGLPTTIWERNSSGGIRRFESPIKDHGNRPGIILRWAEGVSFFTLRSGKWVTLSHDEAKRDPRLDEVKDQLHKFDFKPMPDTRSLEEAVQAFNQKQAEHPIGKGQPPLTEDAAKLPKLLTP
ncbi:MAG: serine/threonine-protein kinase [Pirellulaceae bacterium]